MKEFAEIESTDLTVFKSFETLLLIMLKGKSNLLNKFGLKKVYQ